MSDSDRDSIEVDFPCPHCGADAYAGHNDLGDPVVVHAMPPCDYFVRADALEFVTEARKRAQRGDPRQS